MERITVAEVDTRDDQQESSHTKSEKANKRQSLFYVIMCFCIA